MIAVVWQLVGIVDPRKGQEFQIFLRTMMALPEMTGETVLKNSEQVLTEMLVHVLLVCLVLLVRLVLMVWRVGKG